MNAQVQASQVQNASSRLVVITDAGQDLDDEVRGFFASAQFYTDTIPSFYHIGRTDDNGLDAIAYR